MTRAASLMVLVVLVLTLAVAASAADYATALEAARNGDRAALAGLIEKHVDVNKADGDGSTALHWASYRDDAEAVDMLIRAGAKVNATTDLGATALWAASQNGSERIVRRLLEAGADPNIALISGETSTMVAARGGYASVVELLAVKGANVNAHATRGQTALMWAAAEKHPAAVQALLAHKADVHAKSDVWNEVMATPPHGYPEYNWAFPHGGETALMFAARVGDLESTRLLVAAGSNVNDADAWGVSATALAAHSNFTDVVELLLDKGADASAAKAGFSALHLALMNRNEKMAVALLNHGANPNDPVKTWTPSRRSSKDLSIAPELVGATPLWLAARWSLPGVMRLLIEKGADPLFVHHGEFVAEAGKREDGFPHRTHVTTPLMAAMGMGGGEAWASMPTAVEKEALALEAAKLTIVPGVDVNIADSDGKTALDSARTLRYTSVVNFLVEHGAKSKGR